MTKEEAKKEVQRLLAEASEIVDRAEKLMDEHRFSASFLEKDYCPNNLTEAELEEGGATDGSSDYWPINRDWMSEGDGGTWMSSSDQC